MKPVGFFCFVAGVFLLSGCTKAPHSHQSAYAPAKDIQASFSLKKAPALASDTSASGGSADSVLAVDHAKISIQKSALEKEFLFQAELIMQAVAPQFHGLQSRIVSFRQRDGKLFLVETSKGHSFVPDFPQTLLLAEFPILSETDTAVTFDFGKGMSDLFVSGDWKASDFGTNPPDGNVSAIKVGFSYIDDASFSASNNLVIRQVAQLFVQDQTGGLQEEPVVVSYALQPYLENPDFKSTASPVNLDRVGFFEVSPLINSDSGITIFATKRDISKPIVYAISDNTPADFKQAVKDGILYWNRALGHDLISVIDAPPGVTAPNIDYNIVQWVDWESAGFAYADAQMDPRTGEILHQQIYFTSAWAKIGKVEARMMAQELGLDAPATDTSLSKQQIGLRGFSFQNLCDMDLNRALLFGSEVLLTKKLTEAQTLKAAQDLIREVVAHEVGHTMGLRHNFAGSLAANYALSQREEIFRKYLLSGEAPGDLVTTSSVMDYQFPLESMLNGDQIAKGHAAGEYDRKAIQMLYYGATYDPSGDDKLPLFCTDSHAASSVFADCRPYDAGSSFVEWAQYLGQSNIKNLPYLILFTYQNEKNPAFGMPSRPLEQVGFDAARIAKIYLAQEQVLMGLFPAASQLLSNTRSFAYVNGSNVDEVRTRLEAYTLSELEKYQGLAKVFLQVDPLFAEREIARFEALMADPANLSGVNPNGKPFSFSDSEIANIKKNVQSFYNALQAEMIKQETTIFAGTAADEKMRSGSLGDTLATYLSDRAGELLFTAAGSPLVIKKLNEGAAWVVGDATPVTPPTVASTYHLPRYFYPFEVRQTATILLRPGRSLALNWAFSERMRLGKKYADSISDAFPPAAAIAAPTGATLQPFATAPEPLIEWLQEALTLKAALN